MKTLITLLVCFLMSSRGHDISRKEDTVTKIKRFYAEWNEVRRAKDIDRFVALYTDDFISFPQGSSPQIGKQALRRRALNRFRTGTDPGVLTFQGIVLDCGNSFVTWYTGTIFPTNQSATDVSGVRVLVMEKGKLKIKLGIFNNDTPQEEATTPTTTQATKPTQSRYPVNPGHDYRRSYPYYNKYPHYGRYSGYSRYGR